jgi:hypothetical protein
MAEKRFVVRLKSGDVQTVYADIGDQDDEEDGYVFFVNSKGDISGLFWKPVVAEWHEEPERTGRAE